LATAGDPQQSDLKAADSIALETNEPSLTEGADITKIELATAGDPQQSDLKAADSIALETNEPSLTEGSDITKIELATADDRQPIASYSEPETEEPSPPDEAIGAELGPGGEPLQPSSIASPSSRLAPVSASVRGLRALTGIMIVGTLSAGAIAAVLYLKAANPYQQASGIAESKDIPLEFHSRINKQTNKMEAFVVGWQENQNGVGAEIVGECANRNIVFKATVVGRDGTPDHLLWGDKLEGDRNSIGILPISVKINDGEPEVIKRLREGADHNVIRLATLQLESPDSAQLDDNLSMEERTALASYSAEKIFNIAEVRVLMVRFKTSEGTVPIKVTMDDPAIRKFVQACQKQ
jgi:hypothetical protein